MMIRAPYRVAVAILIVCFCLEARAEFGSVPITRDSAAKMPLYSAPKTTVTAPVTAPGAPSTAATLPSGPAGKKWLQHESGYVILVDADQVPGQGFKEIRPPVQAPMGSAMPPTPAPAMTQPSYQAPVPSTYAQPQGPTTFTNPAFTQPPVVQSAPPAPSYTMPAQTMAATGVPPGKKWMQHKSGYRVIVDQSTVPGPEFVDIPPPNTPPPGAGMQQAYPQQQLSYAPMAQQAPAVPQSAFSQQQTYAPQGPQTYSQIPITGQATPARPYTGGQQQLSSVPPNLQRQLPYQPPVPPGMVAPQVPYQQPGQMGYGGAKPVVRSAPPGKKWLQADNGMRYLVGQSTIPGPGFREISEEEASKPVMLSGPPPQQQQQPQQQQPQQQGGFMSWLNNLGR
jgi:hypothetical protein